MRLQWLFLCLFACFSSCTCEGPNLIDCQDDPSVCPSGTVCGPDGVCIPQEECDASAGETACGGICCAAGEVCEDDVCVPEILCDAGQTACGPNCCDDLTETCVVDTCVDSSIVTPCQVDDECQNDTHCVDGRCIPFGIPPDEVNNPECQVLVPLGVFNPAIQCEWQPEDSLTPCSLPGVVGNPNYPHGLLAPECPGREVCVDLDVTDADTSRFCIDPHRQILQTPMVINFQFPPGSRGNPSGIPGGRPSLVFGSYDQLDGGDPAGTSNGIVRVVDGATCQTLYTIEGVDPGTGLPLFTMGASPVALGDIDRAADGRPEIVAHAHGGGLWAFKYDEALDDFVVLWHSTNPDGSLNQHNRGNLVVDAFGFESFTIQHWSGPTIADLDDDGSPEILMSGSVFNADGVALFEADTAFENDFRFVGNGQFPVVADVDLDGFPELVTGDRIFDWVSAGPGQPGEWVPSPSFVQDAGGFDGHVAIGDFGSFPLRDGTPDPFPGGFPEIVVVNGSAGGVLIQTIDGQRIFGPFPIPGGGLGGPPTVGDFDGDGLVEFAEAGGRAYTIFDLECVSPAPTACTQDTDCGAGLACPAPGRCSRSSTSCSVNGDCPGGETCILLSPQRVCVPDGCEGNGFRWSQISQDLSSNRTGSSIFDFEGDGKVEAVYADECYTRVYDGNDGTVLFSQFHTSCTWYENAIVADVDGDLRSEIVVGSNENCTTASSCFSNAFVVDAGPDGLVGTSDDVRVDPIFPGLRCASDADCPGGPCVDELCRCTSDAECGGGDFVCSPTLAGSTSVTDQNVCRAAFRIDTTDGRPGITGVRVYRDVADRWVGSRPIWNQHAYSITHVEDDGTIPQTSQVQNNWQVAGLNNFRQNIQGALDPDAFPDLTGGGDGDNCSLNQDGTQTLTLTVNVCNRGTQAVGAGVPVAFYEGLTPELLRCQSQTTLLLNPGECEQVSCDISPAPVGEPTDFLVVVDDDGSGQGERAECFEGNNQATLLGLTCINIK